MIVGAVGGLAVADAMAPSAPRGAATDPEKERAEAEAKAAQAANAKLAEDQKRRRAQGSLLARGGQASTGPSLGDADTMSDSPLSAGVSSARRSAGSVSSVPGSTSLMSRGKTYGTTERAPVRPSRLSAT